MKVSRIEIKDFNQFKNIDIDLTYPKGHSKEGQPLDKVCFIGQSGTGKTTLLELIPKFITGYDTTLFSKLDIKSVYNKIIIKLNYGNNNEHSFDIKYGYADDNSYSGWIWENPTLSIEESGLALKYFDEEWENKIASKIIYFPANLRHDIDIDDNKKIDSKKIIDFSKDKVANVWNLIMDGITKYQEEEITLRQKISKIVEESKNDLIVIQEAIKELEIWKKNEFNPVEDIAKHCLNPLLLNFGLRVKTELDFKTKEDIGFIKIEDFNGSEIPNGLWSTGTKQIVLSALPLYLLKPKNTVILFDEPERSLYPDMQRMVIDYYSSLTKDSQFFYATHSPIIASSFEPWEIIELKLNENGHVYQDIYYEGERHVDNYKWNPKYMRWDDILQRIFDLSTDGSLEREKKLNELAMLNVKYRKLKEKNTKNTTEMDAILSEINQLKNILSKYD